MYLPATLSPTQAGQRALTVVPTLYLAPTLCGPVCFQSCADEKNSLLTRSILLSKIAKSEFLVCVFQKVLSQTKSSASFTSFTIFCAVDITDFTSYFG